MARNRAIDQSINEDQQIMTRNLKIQPCIKYEEFIDWG